jgi:hypothetical protein
VCLHPSILILVDHDCTSPKHRNGQPLPPLANTVGRLVDDTAQPMLQ